MSERILVVEDDPRMADLLRRGLIFEGYQVELAGDGETALSISRDRMPDLVVLDLMLPGALDGLEVCRRLRAASDLPILVLTARGTLNDKVHGLDSGADDYVVKADFHFEELLARIRALLRRRQPPARQEILHFADLSLYPGSREALRGDRRLELTAKEFDLLELFMRNPRQVLTRDMIYDRIWNYDFGGESNIIEVYIRYLRAKLEASGELRLLHTVRGVGYVLRRSSLAYHLALIIRSHSGAVPNRRNHTTPPMTLRFRLTLWYTILLALMLLTFALVFHGVLARTLSEQVDDTLRSQAEQIVTIFEQNIDPAAAQLPTAIVLSSQVFAQATTSTGELINSSPNLGDMRLPWPDTTKQQNLAGQAALYTWQDSQDTLRILSAPVRSPSGEIAAVVHVAQSLTPIRQMLDTVRLALLIGSGIALVLAAVGGAAISGTALRPLNRIAQTASRIARAEDLNQRIEGAYPNDEVGQLAETFNEMMERLQDLFETQQQLVADVSHELRTPLATIQGNVDLMRRAARRDPSMLVESIDAVDAEVARMSRLVRDLLLLAEADAGLSLNLKPVEVDTVLLEVYRQAQIMASGKVKVRLGHEDQALVQGDADRLKQLLLNLVSNAIAYTPEGSASPPKTCRASSIDSGAWTGRARAKRAAAAWASRSPGPSPKLTAARWRSKARWERGRPSRCCCHSSTALGRKQADSRNQRRTFLSARERSF